MEKARAVLDRLNRIEALRRDETPSGVLLDEVRALLAEAEEWVEDEPGAEPGARKALERCREAFAAGERNAGSALAAR